MGFRKAFFRTLWPVAVWLAVWQWAATAVGQEIFLASPVSVLVRLVELMQTSLFYRRIVFSGLRILAGYGLAMTIGVVFAALSASCSFIRNLLFPPMAAIRIVPVASFTILALIAFGSRNLSIFVAFLIALPLFYQNTLDGIQHADPALLEMARVFHMPFRFRLRLIYMPQVFPYFRAAVSVALGLAWKSGVAAEVIGIPAGSIGEMLYRAKIYLQTGDLFAWTFVIVLASVGCEKLVSWGFAQWERRWIRGSR